MNRVLRLSSIGMLMFSLSATLSGCWGPIKGMPVSNLVGKELTQEQRFTLKNLHEEAVSLDQVLTQNKAVLLDFWATWCGYCVEEMPALIKLYEKYRDRGFTLLGVNVGESKEQAQIFAQRMNVPFPIVLDQDNRVTISYGVVGIPTSILMDSNGMIIGEYHAYTRQLEDDIEKALAK